jgi:molybdopterin converting factor small subunit
VASVRIRFWAGARRAAGHAEETLDVADVASLRAALAARPELAQIVASASFLVDEVQASDTAALRDGAVVDVLPPFAGGGRRVSQR